MWNELLSENDIKDFMERFYYFHDSCIKEIHYLSGAYVEDNLSMYPVNDRRLLRVVLQRQFADIPMVELEFEGVKYFKLCPADEEYTCEILDSTLIQKDGFVYWADSGSVPIENIENYDGTIICATKLRWRSIEKCLGQNEFYKSIK